MLSRESWTSEQATFSTSDVDTDLRKMPCGCKKAGGFLSPFPPRRGQWTSRVKELPLQGSSFSTREGAWSGGSRCPSLGGPVQGTEDLR